MLVLFVVFVVTFFLNFLSVDTCTLYDFAFFTFAIFTVSCFLPAVSFVIFALASFAAVVLFSFGSVYFASF